MKKALSSILICASLLLPFSSSAFAEKGYADSKETAVELTAEKLGGRIQQKVGYLDYQDSDFYKFTNKTGSTIVAVFVLDSSVSFINYDIRAYFPNGDILTGKDEGAGKKDAIYDVKLRPGEVIYLEVKGHTARDFGKDAPYHIYVIV
ncbi:hypothetical protein M5X00_18620 [Paenibacillus alvei]|uniref:Uncharacterized protein n=1 Tax=Paenibacillus alvei TaxID=44250 RepID=A0ABT4H670_PAEAL|nr:hypothetical protein [Paenibacillus alvei]EJW15661.1 hypothetical protein PAV_7c00340 [Paenibacillus alvei DSM 29]MCY9541884.1 hypothetical protein [Paenibacillus alvei]MCY9707517.1 hypothetical protein [Paenibacillus alvei]MCY9734083.1 hypothetical protein [Paenibacillus alvei]MCY9756258.1 hypothetical protein [Paenibacillus alvei]